MDSKDLEEKIIEAQRKDKCKRMERMKRNQETARKLAQVLSETQANYSDIDAIFRMSKEFLSVSFIDTHDIWDCL